MFDYPKQNIYPSFFRFLPARITNPGSDSERVGWVDDAVQHSVCGEAESCCNAVELF